jgi:hypothetical protein
VPQIPDFLTNIHDLCFYYIDSCLSFIQLHSNDICVCADVMRASILKVAFQKVKCIHMRKFDQLSLGYHKDISINALWMRSSYKVHIKLNSRCLFYYFVIFVIVNGAS